MIAVIETITGGISHEAFNAGMLYQLHNVYPNEEIIYFCEKEQAKCVKRILAIHGCKNIRFSTINRIYVECTNENIVDNKQEYIHIFKKCLHAKFVLILTMDTVNSGLVKNFMKKFYYLKFGVCIHGCIENILPQNEAKFCKNHQKKRELDYFKKNLDDMTKLPNCNIILYSDVYKKYKNCISQSLYANIKVLNLPYVFTYDKKEPAKSNIFRIGIMPSSAAAEDKNCIKIIQYMSKQKNRIFYPYKFLIFNYNIGCYENVNYINKPGKKRSDIEYFMKLCHWILIPCDKSKYILSSSGVMFDSIEEERPFFALDSKCFTKAIEAGCGIRETTIDALGERIIEEINGQDSGERYSQYSKNIRNYKKRIEKENLKGLAEIFG